MPERASQHRAEVAWLGATAGGLTVAAMLTLRLVAGLPSLIDVTGTGLALLLPGPVFGTLIDALQERGRPLLLLGTALLLILVAAGVAVGISRWARPVTAPSPAAAPGRRGNPWGRWLLPALGLWVLTLPLLVISQGSLATVATWSCLGDWLLLCLLVELLLGAGQPGGTTPGALLARQPGALSRRGFLSACGAVLGAASLGYLGLRLLQAGSPPVPSAPGVAPGGRLPADLTPTSEFYVVSKDLFGPPQIDAATWSLSVEGSSTYRIGYSELSQMASVEQIQTLECISNPVGGTLISNGVWQGVPLRDLLARAALPARATDIVFDCADGYSESLPVAEALSVSTLVATRLNGRALPAAHGFPARILVAGHYGMKDPKWLSRIYPLVGSYQGYWEQQGWNAAAVPHIFSRFDFPAGSRTLVGNRRYLLTGVAYAGARGVGAVEVSFDGGSHWLRASLQPVASPYAWTIWSLPWTSSPGLYTLTVRASDRSGRVQTGRPSDSYPNGATGYQQLIASVV